MYFRFIELSALICFHTIRFAWRLLFSRLRKKRASWKALLGQSMTELCEALGATFIKIGQILSTRCDLLPQEITTPLTSLQDHIKPFAFAYVPTLIQAQLRQPLQAIFIEFDEQPISSASIASVYRARLASGQVVAVKIRRPDIVRKVRNDLRLMRFFARGIALLPAMKLVPVTAMINELGQSIVQQLDLRIEAQNTLHFRQFFAQEPEIQIPALCEDYCTEAILVMEFIDHLIRVDELDWKEEDYQKALVTGLRALYRMIFVDGFIHCDLHPGNFYLRKEGHVVILDTGFIARMSPDDRFQFAKFFLSIAMNAGKNCARIIYETASYKAPTFDQQGFEHAVVELIARNTRSKASVFQVAPFVYQIFDIQRRFGLRSSNSFTMAILSLLVFEGITKQVYPQLDFQAEARPILLEVIAQKRTEVPSSL